MSSKKSKKKINGGDIIKNMFGGMDLKDIETIGKLTLANTILLYTPVALGILGIIIILFYFAFGGKI